MSNIKFVNVFQGTGKSSQPKEGSLYSKWNLLKGKAGNVSPSACLPFGSVSCSPYSGGYSSGYGNFKPSGPLQPIEFFEGDKIIGFSHFNHSGCGAFGFYYNYLVTTPYIKSFTKTQQLKAFDGETASPGYYACHLIEENIKCEVTVSTQVALHRYTSVEGNSLNISVDISNNGLRQDNKRLYGYSTESEFQIHKNGAVGGFVTMQGVKIYFYVACSNSNSVGRIWIDGETIAEKGFKSLQTEKRFGCLFETDKKSVDLKIGFSLVSEEKAKKAVETAPDFDVAQKTAEEKWEEKLNSIELIGVSPKAREVFYSNLYHTLVKPSSWKNECFLWREDKTFFLDFATVWDMYKTQIPLLFTLYKDVGRGIVETLLNFGKQNGKLFNALMLTTDTEVGCGTQACCLGCYLLYDAYCCGLVEEKQVDDMFAVVTAEVEQYREEILKGTFEKTTKLLDCTLICGSFAKLAQELGREEDEKYFAEIAEYWTNAFGEDGLLKAEYPYYEGNRWNYSFRFVHDVKKRIFLAGGKEKLLEQLDAFFGFNDNNEKQDRFEGFNNEPDMEAPYFYQYLGRYDRTCEILDECVNECFRQGREGLPGNNDSGGLSACYLWNFLGLYPQSGNGLFFMGLPQAEKAVVRLSNGNTLTIISHGKGTKIQKISFNGEEICGYSIPVRHILQGGELAFYKS